ncbi:WhiB family transcriptional regulator [Microbispora rosea]|uniref:WhiB family transcriptional regulator n=1 Tax=Microbispora rosea TaxID=58117 RepID=UPI0037886BC3
MSTPTLRLTTLHPALRLLDSLTGGMPAELAENALCDADPELHTGPDIFTEESADERAAREDVAKELCADCPVRALCLARALRLRPEVGVWAGLTAQEIGDLDSRAEVA